ncbi:MAG: caspase family protein [Saprospiraceae bacterium]|nr:caspase family protein [Saprospiraceae bacterium]
MKFRLVYQLIVFLAVGSAATGQNSTYALLTGVGEFPTQSGWNPLSSSNDVALIQKSLKEYGIPANNITVRNDKLTKNALLNSIEDDLIKKVKPGDFAFFHFSGHGQQIPDQNGDEIDGLDEAIVPYDSPKKFEKGRYEGENLILDDELNQLFSRLRKKLGPTGRLLISLDACHSGSATRGIVNARGTDLIMAEDQSAFINSNQEEYTNLDLINQDNSNLAPQTNFYSSSPHQLSYEFTAKNNKTYGLYSYAFCKSLQELSAEDSYIKLWERLSLFISSQNNIQTPYAEGRINEKVFGKISSETKSAIRIKKVIKPDFITISAGALQGITEGSIIGIYSISDQNFTKPLLTGIADGVDAFTSDIQLERKWKFNKLLNYKVKIHEIQLDEFIVKLKFNDFSPIVDELSKQLSSHKFIQFDNNNYELAVSTNYSIQDSIQLELITKEGIIIYKVTFHNNNLPEEITNELFQKVFKYSRARNLKLLESKDNFFQAKLELLLLDSSGQYVITHKTIFNKGDYIKIKISNNGKEEFYFSLIDIPSNSMFTTVYPNHEINAIDCLIPPGKAFISLDGFEIIDPKGTEVLKLICSKTPIDLASTRGQSPNRSPFQMFLNSVLEPDLETRGLKPNLSTEQGYIGSYSFIVH